MQHFGRDVPVIPRRQRLAHFVDDVRDHDRRRRAIRRGQVIPDRERNAEGEDDRRENQESPHLDGASIVPAAANR